MTDRARWTSRTLDLDALRAFVAAAEHGGFAPASEVLHLTSSGVSMRVRRLENREGVHLFARGVPPLVLTPAGERLLPFARRLLALNGEARAILHAPDDRRPPVRVGAMEDYARRVLPDLVAAFSAAEPCITIRLAAGLTAGMRAGLGARYDLVLATHPAGVEPDGALVGVERPVWAAGPAFRLSARGPVPLALHAEGCLFRRWGLEALERRKRPWRAAWAGGPQARVEAAARRGLGCTQVRRSTLAPGLRLFPDMPELPEAEVRLHAANDLPPPAQAFAAFLRERLSV